MTKTSVIILSCTFNPLPVKSAPSQEMVTFLENVTREVNIPGTTVQWLQSTGSLNGGHEMRVNLTAIVTRTT